MDQLIMKKIYLFLIAIFYCSTISIAQDTICPPLAPHPLPEPEEIYKVVEKLPKYPDCEEDTTFTCAKAKIEDFIYKHLVHPEEAIAKKIEGIVVLRCTMNREGMIVDVRIHKDIGGGCGTSALNAALKLPTIKPKEKVWKPSSARSKDVRFGLDVPIRFQF